MLVIAEISNEQRRQLVDCEQIFGAWREASAQFHHSYEGSYRGGMRWGKRAGRDYLLRKIRKTETSLGPRSPETEQLFESYTKERARLRRRITQTRKRLEDMRRVNIALRLNRVPIEAAKVLRKLDEAALIGSHLCVAGTNALFAYEVAAGIMFGVDLVATQDLDVLLDGRRRLTLAADDMVRKRGVLGLLQKADSSYVANKSASFRATNDNGYMIDVICPNEKPLEEHGPRRLGEDESDLEPMPIDGLQWLLNAPKLDAVAIGQDGLPVQVSCVDPRVFSLHKLWLSKQVSRSRVKRKRDADQAAAVAALCVPYFNLSFDSKELTALPLEVCELKIELLERAASVEAA